MDDANGYVPDDNLANDLLRKFISQQFGIVRVIIRNNETWFVAADVCRALELSDVSKSLERLDDDEKGTSSIRTPGGDQKMLVVNEPGLYSLVLGSRKPEAKAFKRWRGLMMAIALKRAVMPCIAILWHRWYRLLIQR